jgi:hypothetical protein
MKAESVTSPTQSSDATQKKISVRASHAELVEEARRWLARKCSVVMTEVAGVGREEPDAIGWRGTHSILIECKATRADFKADQRKAYRRGRTDPDFETGIGDERYYLTVPHTIGLDDLPDERWGVMEWDGKHRRMYVVKNSEHFRADTKSEVALLLSAVRRIGQTAPQGLSVRFYLYQTKQRATLGIQADKAPPEAAGARKESS